MINLRNIWTVSVYERKILYRSWFFRIFSIIALVFLFGINMGLFGFHGGIQWTTRAIPANLPYINVLFINVAQAVIAVFLASDFLRRDTKLDTTEVIYTRPVSNGEYVVGKTLGILILFVGLVLAALLMALVFNLVRQDVPVEWRAYLYYPLLITIPTLVFILGLSFILMILIRNQAVTFVLLLGYIGLTLFYFKDKLHGLLDYMAFNLPLVYSDFIGFGEPGRIILQRLSYLCMGGAFIFATIRFLNRLPQVGRWNALNVTAFLALFAAGSLAGYRYHSIHHQEDLDREAYLFLNDRFALTPRLDVISNRLDLEQKGRKLKIASELVVRNPASQPMDTLVFSLNPGFRLDSIRSLSGSMDVRRNRQILQLIPAEGLKPGEKTGFTIFYSGIPLESIAYLDIPDERLRQLKRIQVATLDKKPGILNRDFLLLTPELVWYPVAGVRFNQKTYLPGQTDFVRYELKVRPNSGFTPVAPGHMEMTGDIFHFTPETDLNALALVIGPFEKRSLMLEDMDLQLYLKPGHDYFSDFFAHIRDTLAYLIEEQKSSYEYEELDLYYPFRRLSLVEVPIQFHAYERPQVQTIETVLPEMILIPEKGAGLDALDFGRYRFFEERRNRRENESRTPEEIEIRLFQRFINAAFFREMQSGRPFAGNPGQRGRNQIMVFRGTSYERNPYHVFPLYYTYMTGISSPGFPLFNSMLEIYLREGFGVSLRQSITGGMNENEKANLALKDHSVNEIFTDWDNSVTSSLISQIGSFIFLALKNRVGLTEFDNFLYYYLEDHAFTEITLEQFSEDFYREFGVEIQPYFETINTKGKIPSFIMSNPVYIQTRDEIGEVYLVRFSLRNTGDVKGIVDISFRVAGSFGGASAEQRIYELDAGVTKDIQITLFDQPRIMTVNTLISGNIPSIFSFFLRSAEVLSVTEMEEYDRISDRDPALAYPGEFIVDNEDPGFEYISVSNESKLKQYIDSRKGQTEEFYYEPINPRYTPLKWTPLAHSAFYGEAVRSALVTRSGDGGNVASWATVLPASGFYDVYVYIPMSAMLGRPGGRGRSGEGQGGRPGAESARMNPGGRGRGPSFADYGVTYHYTLSSNEGTEKVEFTLRNIEEGWNRLGAFHFPGDTARISLSNKTNGRRVFADAVKWVRR